MLKPRNGYVVCSVIEKSTVKVGALIVPVLHELFAEATVIEISDDVKGLKPGQIVFVEYKRASGPPNAQGAVQLKVAGIPLKHGRYTYHVFQEAQIIGVIAENQVEYDALQKANSIAATEEKLLA